MRARERAVLAYAAVLRKGAAALRIGAAMRCRLGDRDAMPGIDAVDATHVARGATGVARQTGAARARARARIGRKRKDQRFGRSCRAILLRSRAASDDRYGAQYKSADEAREFHGEGP